MTTLPADTAVPEKDPLDDRDPEGHERDRLDLKLEAILELLAPDIGL